jgi:hypothetical protein
MAKNYPNPKRYIDIQIYEPKRTPSNFSPKNILNYTIMKSKVKGLLRASE